MGSAWLASESLQAFPCLYLLAFCRGAILTIPQSVLLQKFGKSKIYTQQEKSGVFFHQQSVLAGVKTSEAVSND
jgi:hypothetical protein